IAMLAAIPGVVGAVDCTHTSTFTFTGNIRIRLTLAGVGILLSIVRWCDHDLRIRNVVTRWAGSTHDARSFDNSRLKSNSEEGLYCGVLLGDHGYPLRKYLLTCAQNPTAPAERRYNRSHNKARTHIGIAFRMLKQRFARLCLGLCTSAVRASNIIVACTVLQNLAIDWDEPPVPHPGRHPPHPGHFGTVMIGPQTQEREGLVFRRTINYL
ncbi:UNVERIFIED_CONTAM: hypothetical protein FKN15_044735, partial [Acipenser sinensis]